MDIIMKKEKDPKASSLSTKLCYATGDIGCNFVWTFISGFLMLYYTDSVGVSAAFVGTMFFICRALDGMSDLGMGVIIEKTSSRFGKARPWVLLFSIPLSISLLLIFNVPATLPYLGKQVYIYTTYILMAVICYTAVNLSYNAMLPRFSLTSHDRNLVSAIKGAAVIVAALLVSLLTPFLMEAFGGYQSQKAWSQTTAIYAVIALVMLLITFFGVKEKIAPNIDEDGKPAKVEVKKALSLLIKNKYFYVATALFVVFYAITGTGGVGIYFARDILGDANLFGLISAIAILPMIIGIPILPAMYKKFGKRNVMLVGALVSAAGCLLQLINPASLPLYLTFAIVRGFGSIMFSLPIFTLASDIVELDERRYGFRAEGLVTSSNSLGIKVGTGLGAAMVGWILALGKYDADAAVQLDSSLNAMIVLQIGMPLVLSLVLAVLLIFWDIEKKLQVYDN
ncbi:MAG: glycoside-pentoside-hexuronide (GPH):cation symporter [Lachnospiraceae bacterium]|nr:glycoside-pentoside-hexuronide (GPH):cation symporter [Lachnospiraceae bacterium]